MFRSYKIELKPTKEQKLKIHRTIGVCKFVYNLYLTRNKEEYCINGKCISAFSFSKWLNNDFIPHNPSYLWIKNVSSKAVKQSIINAEKAYKKFFSKQGGFPRYKKKIYNSVKIYLPKNNRTDWTIERHRVKIPTFGFVRLKEFGYIPLDSKIKSGCISLDIDKYFVSILCEISDSSAKYDIGKDGIGIDLGIEKFVTCSDGRVFQNISKTVKVKKLKKRIRREQQKLSRKYKLNKNGKKATTFININRNKLRIQKLYRRLRNIRIEYVRFVVNSLVKANNLPKFIAIEDLNISAMLKNKYMSKFLSEQLFYYFRVFLMQQCHKYGVELRVVNRYYASSKTCSLCEKVKHQLQLSERMYCCDCGNNIDRDRNASINLRNCKLYIHI